MPRIMAPPPSGEFSIRLTKPFSSSPTPSSAEKIEILVEPNRFATIKHTSHTGAQNQTLLAKQGTIQAEDANELLALVQPLGGLPTNAGEDVYGLDARVVLSTFEVQWDNGEEGEGEGGVVTEENREVFRGVVESVEALARMKAKERIS
ncbi:MAG: hypothetical protein Q9219_005566 [cf. Caloplaca sp. 3 TL-2023]